MSTFKAFRVFADGGTVQGRVVETTLDELSAGDVVINAAYSSVNYKDALAATGRGQDHAAVSDRRRDRRRRHGRLERGCAVSTGDQVLVTGYDLGVAHDGGYAGRVRVPADWVVPVPPGLTTFE